MKQFGVYATVKLTSQPTWLAAFRVQYRQQYDWHVTLKQPCVIEDAQVGEVKKRFATFFGKLNILGHAIPVDFNQLVVDGPTEDDACIMGLSPNGILARNCLVRLQTFGVFAAYQT